MRLVSCCLSPSNGAANGKRSLSFDGVLRIAIWRIMFRCVRLCAVLLLVPAFLGDLAFLGDGTIDVKKHGHSHKA